MRCDGDRFDAMERTVPDVLEGLFHDLLAALSRVVDVGEEIQCPNRRIFEHEGRIDELIVLEGRRRIAAIHQLAVLEGTTMEPAASEFDALVPEGLVDVVHCSAPRAVTNLLHAFPLSYPSYNLKINGRYPTPKQALNLGVSFATPATTDMLLTLLIPQYKQR